MLTIYKIMLELGMKNSENNNYTPSGLEFSIGIDGPTSDQGEQTQAMMVKSPEFKKLCITKELANQMYLDGDCSEYEVEELEKEIQSRLG